MEKQEEHGTRVLEEYLDKEVVVGLRDGSYVYGTLRSFDQYHNVLLENTKEICVIEGEYTEETSEVYMLRGENMVLLTYGVFAPNNLKKVKDPLLFSAKKTQIPEDLDYIAL
ncbi:U6 snRNA-associated Sm-like protein LSm1 [Nematocida sp. LUAm3]|nr:U6 snRNA-associated Sm-like protein LSm1 [Nematocida sp. LUAm3]KAI5173695.1 U6 snRNA-associated Sm-like protein LSm1 [Nematocida sp. LUAm2]KAI5176917.1 U6 snRNA-associated Sm-like protein LSm1 [Nematocida sp. LUAm1]